MSNTSFSEPTLQSGNGKNQAVAPALWNPTIVSALSAIFSPVFGSILVLLNWQALGIKEKIRSALLWLTISIIMLVVIFYDYWPLPSPLFQVFLYLTYLIVWYFYLVKPQANYINEHWKQAYTRRGGFWQLLIPMVLGGTTTFPFNYRVFGSLFSFDAIPIVVAVGIFTVLFSVIGFAIGEMFIKSKNGAIILAAVFMIIVVVNLFILSLFLMVMPV